MQQIELIPDESEMVERTLYPLLPVIGPRHGSAVGAIMAGVRSGDWQLNDDGTATVGGVDPCSRKSSSSPRVPARATRSPRTATCSWRSTPA